MAAATQLGVQRSGRPAQCYLAVPMLVGEEAIGVMTIQCKRTESIINATWSCYPRYAAQAAVALENTRLFATVQQELGGT